MIWKLLDIPHRVNSPRASAKFRLALTASISLAALCAACPCSAFAIPQTPTADAAQTENPAPSQTEYPNAADGDVLADDDYAAQTENPDPSQTDPRRNIQTPQTATARRVKPRPT